ncbi:MAG: hypothetical protein LBE09_03970 [Christensenellaceae bacterium]|nr:hypothetical protein [Christensenellaceae bacterium]
MNGGITTVRVGVVAEIDENGAAKEGAYIEYFYVNVYYLNRQPTLIERQIASGSNVTYSVVYQRTTTSIYSFTIDPINYDYDVTSGQYRLPTVLRVTFTSTYPDGDPRALYVSNEGTTFMLRDVRWVYPEIPLSGTATLLPAYILLPFDTSTEMIFEIGMPVAGGYANYQKPDYEIANKNGKAGIASFFDLHLDVTDRSIVSTTISEAKPPKEQTPYGVTHVAINAIDPYNIEFPTTVGITFKEGTGTVTRSFTNVVWEYDKSYLENEAVISGLIGDAAMTVLAKMKVYGAILPIQFPIKDRNIDTEIGGSTIAIDGGTIYILKGIPASEQLPQYLYYNFNGEFARVPIVWSLGNTVKTDDVIVYENIAATLGTVNKNNIVFDIEVIDPIVYCLQGIGDAVKAGGFIFDNIIVAVSGDNSYFSGQEAVLLPQRIFVNEAQHYLSVESVQYDIDRKVAVFNCSYDFITIGSGDSTSLRGTDGVSTLLYLSFEVPLDTYPSTAVVSTYSFPDGTAIKHFPLGYPILASDMPPATLSEGGSTTMSTLDLIWDFSSVNIYRAGEYNVVGYYKTAFGNNNSLNFTIIIDKRELSDSQFTISDSWLYRTYSVVGVPLQAPTNLTLGTFLKEDGSGDSTIKYIVEYSPVDTNQWTSVVPVNVGTYQVRIRVDDNNYLSNSTTTPISFTIAQQYVNLNDVTFSINNSAYVNSGATLTFDYDGVAHDKLLISGIPSDDSTFKYTVTYQRMSDFAVIAAPLNAGQYRLVLEIEQSQNSNYDISQTGDLIVYLNINQKQMSYQISNTVTYKGTGYTTLPIANIDMTDPNFIITYKFYNSNGEPISELLDVGLYAYTLEINGGTNYSSAKYGFDSGALPVNVVKRTLDIKLTNLSSEYLSDILDLNLALWFKDTNTGEEFGLSDLSARDQFLIRNYLSVYVDGGISNKHIVGEYAIHVKYDTANTLANYTFNSYQQGNYVITATAAIQIANRAALIEHLQTLTDGEIYKYYLSPGDYGDIEVNRVLRNGSYVLINASVTLIGAYDIAAGEATGETIAVTLRSVIVHSGALTLDIIKMQALPISAGKPGTGVSISAAASDVTISRSYFYRDLNYYVGYIASSTAIMTDPLYKGTVYITDNTVIKGHSIAAALYGGSLVVSDSEISENINGIQVNGNATGTSTNRIAQSVIVINSKFLYNKGTALYILCNVTDANLNFSVMGNDFIGNVLAVKTFEPLTLELLTTQNYMYLNVADLINF